MTRAHLPPGEGGPFSSAPGVTSVPAFRQRAEATFLAKHNCRLLDDNPSRGRPQALDVCRDQVLYQWLVRVRKALLLHWALIRPHPSGTQQSRALALGREGRLALPQLAYWTLLLPLALGHFLSSLHTLAPATLFAWGSPSLPNRVQSCSADIISSLLFDSQGWLPGVKPNISYALALDTFATRKGHFETSWHLQIIVHKLQGT